MQPSGNAPPIINSGKLWVSGRKEHRKLVEIDLEREGMQHFHYLSRSCVRKSSEYKSARHRPEPVQTCIGR
jgi:hypothetical protein